MILFFLEVSSFPVGSTLPHSIVGILIKCIILRIALFMMRLSLYLNLALPFHLFRNLQLIFTHFEEVLWLFTHLTLYN